MCSAHERTIHMDTANTHPFARLNLGLAFPLHRRVESQFPQQAAATQAQHHFRVLMSSPQAQLPHTLLCWCHPHCLQDGEVHPFRDVLSENTCQWLERGVEQVLNFLPSKDGCRKLHSSKPFIKHCDTRNYTETR